MLLLLVLVSVVVAVIGCGGVKSRGWIALLLWVESKDMVGE